MGGIDPEAAVGNPGMLVEPGRGPDWVWGIIDAVAARYRGFLSRLYYQSSSKLISTLREETRETRIWSCRHRIAMQKRSYHACKPLQSTKY
jgi:hypothetical protein